MSGGGDSSLSLNRGRRNRSIQPARSSLSRTSRSSLEVKRILKLLKGWSYPAPSATGQGASAPLLPFERPQPEVHSFKVGAQCSSMVIRGSFCGTNLRNGAPGLSQDSETSNGSLSQSFFHPLIHPEGANTHRRCFAFRV